MQENDNLPMHPPRKTSVTHTPPPVHSSPPSLTLNLPHSFHRHTLTHHLLSLCLSLLSLSKKNLKKPAPMADYQRQQQQQQQQQRPTTEAIRGPLPENGPSTQQIIALVTLVPLGGFLLLLSGLTFFGSLIGLAVSAPVFLLFSPVLVPAAFFIFCAVAGFLTSGAFGITGLSSLTWLANFVRRIRAKHPEQADQAKRRVQDTAGYLGQKARETGQTIQSKAQEVGRGEEGGGRPTQEGGRAHEGKKT